ncbi:MAG: AAA family ATPase [Crocinitomicaceae bacterium]|nr:AAA family ATPase [Crocinitomicaceae bacterium]
MIRIAFTGPESSGKSTLAKAISKSMNGQYVEEFARSYLEENGPDYDIGDLDIMAKGHAQSILRASNSIQLIDTDFVVFKIWSEYKYGAASAFIHRLVSENWFDLHVLCTPDITWEPDDLRENPDDRDILFQQYIGAFKKLRKPYLIVQGPLAKRQKKLEEAINKLCRIS